MTEQLEQSVGPELLRREDWPSWKRAAFRFAFLYWVLYMLPLRGSVSLLDLFPWGAETMENVAAWPLARLSVWVGRHVFHLSGLVAGWHPTGSGDTALSYVAVVCIVVLAVLGTVVWSVIDELCDRHAEYQTAYAWLRLFLRFTLGFTMLTYGWVKIVPLQFQTPKLYDLSGTYGDSTPMHLLWTFMGASLPYTIFSGSMEAIAGLLLMFRRTSTLGAIAAAGVLLNVVLLNFCYDVPVKLYSTHLLLMSLFLLLPDAAPMWRFFVRRRSATLTGAWVPRFERKPLRIAGYVLQGLVLIAILYATAWTDYQSRIAPETEFALHGVWSVDKSQGLKPNEQWTKIIFESHGIVALFFPDGTNQWAPVTMKDVGQTISFPSNTRMMLLHWSKDSSGEVTMTGTWNGNPVMISMHKINPERYVLQTRGFHWVQEFPDNHS